MHRKLSAADAALLGFQLHVDATATWARQAADELDAQTRSLVAHAPVDAEHLAAVVHLARLLKSASDSLRELAKL